MVKKLTSLLALIVIIVGVQAQKLVVSEFNADLTMLDASKSDIRDNNGEKCGLIRMGLAVPGAADAVIEGDIVFKEYKDGEWWLYMGNESTWLTITVNNYLPLRYEFEPIVKNVTYIMSVEDPSVGDSPKGTVVITCNVKDADVYIDGKKMSSVTPYEYKGSDGQHQVEVRANGYNPERSTISIKLNKKLSHTVRLVPAGTIQVCGISYEMAMVKGGTFLMGSAAKPEDKNYPFNYAQPQHEVVLRPYRIGKTEVKQDLWVCIMGSNPSMHQGANLPVENVTYDDCLEFIRRLNETTGENFRLPTEAEWEYAARERGTTGGDECSGGSVSKVAQTEVIAEVGGKKPNSLGIFDMSGNVAEWCSDWIATYPIEKSVAPQGPEIGTHRVVRGGHAGASEWSMYAASRSHQDPNEPSPYIGLRLVLDN